MRRLNRTWFSFVIVGVAASVCPASEDGFVTLFDGQTLNGWTVNHLPKDRELAAKAWSVDGGTLYANTTGHKEHFYIMLSTNREYGDFVLRLRFKGIRIKEL